MWNPEIHFTASLVVFIVERERIGRKKKIKRKERRTKIKSNERKKRKKAKILFNIS